MRNEFLYFHLRKEGKIKECVLKKKTNQKNPQTSVSDLMLTNVPENWEK